MASQATSRLRAGHAVSLRLAELDPQAAAFTLDRRGRVLSWSPGAQRTKGYRPEEIVGRHISCFYAPDEAARGIPEQHLAKAAKEGRFSTKGWRVRKDGSRFWASVMMVALRQADGSLWGFEVVARAVTANDLSRVAMDSMSDRVCVLDGEGAIVFTNQAWDSLDKVRAAGLVCGGLGANYLQICRSNSGPLSSAAAQAAAGIARVLKGAAPGFSLDYPCPSLDQAWIRLAALPLRQSQRGALIVHYDITVTTRLAQRLRRANAYGDRFRNPMDAATFLSRLGIVQHHNPAPEGALGMPAGDLAGRSFFDFVHAEDAPSLRKLLHDCTLDLYNRRAVAYRLRDRRGAWRTMESVARKISSGPAAEILLTSRDITQQKRTEQALLAAQQVALRRHAELGSAIARLFGEHDEARRRVAFELRTNFDQRLAAIRLHAACTPSGNEGREQLLCLQECLATLRRDLEVLADDLHPATLDRLGPAAAVRERCSEFSRKEGIRVRCRCRGASTHLPSHLARTLYRTAGEALDAVARHARAQAISVTLSETARAARLTISGRASAIDCAGLAALESHVAAMRRRLPSLQGSLTFRVRPGNGLAIIALVPVQPAP